MVAAGELCCLSDNSGYEWQLIIPDSQSLEQVLDSEYQQLDFISTIILKYVVLFISNYLELKEKVPNCDKSYTWT